MRLSIRLTLVFGVLGFVTIASVASASYWLAAGESRESIDNELLQRLTPFVRFAEGALPESRPPFVDPASDPVFGADVEDGALSDFNTPGDTTRFQFILADGSRVGAPDVVPTDEAATALDAGTTVGAPFFETLDIDGTTYRVLSHALDAATLDAAVVEGAPAITGIQLYRDISNEQRALSNLATQLAVLSIVGVTVVAMVSWLVGRWLARPIQQLTDVAGELAELDDVPGRVEINRNDEIGRLADSFNRVMSALEIGREQQRRLVADASHELRTPLTSLRMRVEFLAQHDTTDEQRASILGAAVADAEQLSSLVSDLVDLAVDVRSSDEEPQLVVLGDVVRDVVQHARASTLRCIDVTVDDTEAWVRPTMIRRALHNLIDNAVKYSPPPTAVTVSSRLGAIEVGDEGPGIAPEDAEHVFDRFFRSPKARARPGNGIGLAIVKQVAEAHGGTVWVGDRPGGGARVGFSVPVVAVPDPTPRIFSHSSG
jgi:two-component system sensor histidine kinase MprB